MTDSLARLILRVGCGGMLLTHGWPKLSRVIETGKFEFGDPIGLGPAVSLILTIFAEVLCAILVVIGFKTKLASIPPAIVMLVAAFVAHASDPFARKEKALLFLVGFIAIALLGPGEYSLDNKMGGRKNAF